MDLDTLTERLTQAKPARVVAFLEDGSTRDLYPTHRARRWEALAKAVKGFPWERLELYDDKGGAIGALNSNEETRSEDDASTAEDARSTHHDPILDLPGGANIALFIRAQNVAFREMKKVYEPVLDRYNDLLTVYGARLGSLETKYQEILELAHTATVLIGQAKSIAANKGASGEPTDPEEARNKGIEDQILKTLVTKGLGAMLGGEGGGVDLSKLDLAQLSEVLKAVQASGAAGGDGANGSAAAEAGAAESGGE